MGPAPESASQSPRLPALLQGRFPCRSGGVAPSAEGSAWSPDIIAASWRTAPPEVLAAGPGRPARGSGNTAHRLHRGPPRVSHGKGRAPSAVTNLSLLLSVCLSYELALYIYFYEAD